LVTRAQAARTCSHVDHLTNQSIFQLSALGASAGGLDACTKLLNAMPTHLGMAFIPVQHLDPTHESMMPELLAQHTTMTVVQAVAVRPEAIERCAGRGLDGIHNRDDSSRLAIYADEEGGCALATKLIG
jgi:hypothetical protein